MLQRVVVFRFLCCAAALFISAAIFLSARNALYLRYGFIQESRPEPDGNVVDQSQPLIEGDQLSRELTADVTRAFILNDEEMHSAVIPDMEHEDNTSDQTLNAVKENPQPDKKVTLPQANVLMIIADDMRPELGVYASERRPWLYDKMKTPNLDKLAKESLLLTSAYCQQPLCNPSRISLLTSRRPDTTGVTTNDITFRSRAPRVKTMAGYFKDNGYVTMAMGKIFHPLGTCDEQRSWTTDCYLPRKNLKASPGGWTAVSKEQHQKVKLMDEQTLDFTSRNLEQLAKAPKPFFVAMGIKKPHLPFDFPEEFLEIYDDAEMPANPLLPKNVPDIAWNHKHIRERGKNFNSTSDPADGMDDDETKNLRKAYYATISYVDSIVGQVLQKLDSLQLTNETIVVFLSDHAMHLGEHGLFGKKTNFMINAQVPFIIRVPGATDHGIVSDNLVELLDLFPTLVDLTELPKLEACPEEKSKEVEVCTEGVSLLPLLSDPETPEWRSAVRYQYPNIASFRNKCTGLSLLTKKHRLTQWVKKYTNNDTYNWNDECATELYDLEHDVRETENIANDQKYQDIIKNMKATLRGGWKGSLNGIKL